MSTMVRLPLIWTEYEKLAEEEELEYRALDKQPKAISERGNIVVDLEFVASWFRDGNSTIIDLRNGKRYNILIPEDQFTLLYTELTKQIITEVKIPEDDENEEENNDGTTYMDFQ